MHEHFGKLNVGKTICIATGYGLEGKKVLIDVRGNKIRSIKFIRKWKSKELYALNAEV